MNPPGQNWSGSLSLLQGIFLTQGSNPGLLHCRQILYWLSRQGSPPTHDAGRGWGQEEKGTTEDEMAGWHHCSMDMSLSELRELVKDRDN